MKAGRKPKPTALKIISGNPGKRPLKEIEQKFKASRLEMPDFLNAEAKEEWRRTFELLFNAGIVTDADRAALAAYCQSYGIWVQAERELQKLQQTNVLNGLILETKYGNFIQHPMLGIANKARADMVKYAVEFGMTASSRSRIEFNSSGEKENPFAKFDE